MHKLKPSVNIDPMIMGWYAWPHLVAPHTLAMNVVNRHLKVMSSYVQAPELHAEALKSSKLKGAPFLDLPAEKSHLVQGLISETETVGADLIRFCNEYIAFDKLLHDQADGTALDLFYDKLPPSLQGCVELTYDSHHNPQIRLIEPILYDKLYDKNIQSICLGEMPNEERPFSLSTPLIPTEKQLLLDIPFSDPRIDMLSRARFQPVDLDLLIKELGIKESQKDLFSSFFGLDLGGSPGFSPFQESGVRVRYFSHACILIQSKDVSILIDPAVNFETHERSKYFNASDLPEKIDYVLLTHNHQDHVLFETLLQLRHRIGSVIIPRSNTGALHDPSLMLILQKVGMKNILTCDEFDEINLLGGKITCLPFLGEHGDLSIYTKLGYHVSVGGYSFLLMADSNNLDPFLYKNIFRIIGQIDFLFIGMECKGAPLSWLYGALFSEPIPRLIDQSRRLSGSNCEKAMDIIQQSGAKRVFIYAMGLEPWLNNIMAVNYTEQSMPIIESNKLLEICRSKGIPAERLFEKLELVLPNRLNLLESSDIVSTATL
jgi:L-ascorbate metabolism protein UlaG (beta-lactamase superfamily)